MYVSDERRTVTEVGVGSLAARDLCVVVDITSDGGDARVRGTPKILAVSLGLRAVYHRGMPAVSADIR